MKSQLLILDFGSQYTQLIARTVRELGVYCEIVPGNLSFEKFTSYQPTAIILSGGPASVNIEGSPKVDSRILSLGLPIFGICYGMQLLAEALGGKVGGWSRDGLKGEGASESSSDMREFGRAVLNITTAKGIFEKFSLGQETEVWMSHGDKVTQLPTGFESLAASAGSPCAAFCDQNRKIYGVQFHPEVHHTPKGKDILSGFIFNVANLKKDWDPGSFINKTVESVIQKVPTGNVVCGLSGGVDSTVAAVLVHKAIGMRLHCIFVDNGLLRKDEAQEVVEMMKTLGLNLHFVDASERFLKALDGITDPEKKRKAIGHMFIDVFEDEAQRIDAMGISAVKYLVQGTLYPDVIESVSVIGQAVTIKSHHNVGGLKENMKLELIEPLRELFKDEVRKIGHELAIPDSFLYRQPFPGPGLAVRCLGPLTNERLDKLRVADKIVRDEVEKAGLNKEIWQSFAVLLPVQSVGVMGDGRTYEECIAIRAVTSRDGMTADWYMFPEELLRRMSSRIVNETTGVNRVVLDISSKPPSTIEWE